MDTFSIEQGLLVALEQMEIIDGHEHIGPERLRLESHVDAFTLLSHYVRYDLGAAGMSDPDYHAMLNPDIPLDRRWQIAAPYWAQVRRTSYARAAIIAARHFYGVEDIDEHTYEALSAAMQAANTPGIHERVLRDACHIRTALTMWDPAELDSPLLTAVPLIPHDEINHWEAVGHPEFAPGAVVRSLDDLLDALRSYILRVKGQGAVGLKTVSNPHQAPDRHAALEAFASLQSGTVARLPQDNPLRDYLWDQAITMGEEQDMVIAVHTGYWGDFRRMDPVHMIPVLQRHPRARFDVFHLGFPSVREALMLGKGFPNVWLDFCWTHIISQRMATAALDEAIDLLPANKLIAFGGDYHTQIEKVYGHLVMAREDVARVLAKRVAAHEMTETEALALAKQWFWDNPRDLYRLRV